MNQIQQGMTGTGSPFTSVVVGSGTQFVTQLTVSEGNTVVGNGPVAVGRMMIGGSPEEVDDDDDDDDGDPVGTAPAHGHGGGRMVRATGVSESFVGPSARVMTNGGGLTLGMGTRTEGTAPSSVVVMTISE